MSQQWPSFPSEQGRRLQQFSAHQLLGRHFTSNPSPRDGRALPSAHGRTTQSAFLFWGPTTQSAFLFLGPNKNGVLCSGRGRFWTRLAPIAWSSALRRLAAPGPSFWKGNILGIQACSTSGLSCSANPFNRTEYRLYNNGVEDHQRYGWATDRGILLGSSGPWLSAPGLQRVGLPKSSSGSVGGLYYNIGTGRVNTTSWSITSPDKLGGPVWQGSNGDDPLSGVLHRRHSSLNTYLPDTSRVPRKLFDCPDGPLLTITEHTRPTNRHGDGSSSSTCARTNVANSTARAIGDTWDRRRTGSKA